ncbi:MAG TPA: sialate O-acetylesterase [Verrucomicrobiae bacterium]|nr:sialate O-acetylesterase [Verrucomicrobiae bacterium]
MNPHWRLRIIPGLALLLAASSARADVKLHGLFSDHMVLQRDIAAPIWGRADDGEQITVEFRGRKVTTKAAGGRWMARLPKLDAGGPDKLTVTGKNSIALDGVMVGEVWIASGQSNMEWPMRATYDATNEVAKATDALVRLYTVPKLKSGTPVDNVPSAWQPCSPASVSNFSAVAYYFARDLQKALGVPVGIIHTSWGGSPCEVWIREEVLTSNPGYRRDILGAYSEELQRAQPAIDAWEKEKAEAEAAKKPFNKLRPGPWKPSELYNGMIAPLVPYAIKGAIWYQGESNAGRAHQYRTLMADMISNWRHDWKQGDFTFLQVQLAPFKAYKEQPDESDWAELREAQVHVSKVLPKAGIAVITDVGDQKDIHPNRKEPVGARLALAARRIAYGEKVPCCGPTYHSVKIKDGEAILSFDHIGAGLEARSLPPRAGDTNARPTLLYNAATGHLVQPLVGFSICGEDRKFVWAGARIVGDKVVVSSDQVAKPVAVRFGWADFPVVNLWNSDGLPASPFRTDDFPRITAPKAAEVPVKRKT